MRLELSLPAKNKSFFTSKRFLPLFIAQFLGSFEDNLYRNAFFILVTFKLATGQGSAAGLLVSLGAGLFILPYFLFSATAGTIADTIEKARLIRWIKFVEIPLMFSAGVFLVTEQTSFMLAALFLLGLQAAFFGPVKYGILPEIVAEDELIEANAYLQAGTFIAILLGTIMGGAVVTLPYGTIAIASAMTLCAGAGWLASLFVPRPLSVERPAQTRGGYFTNMMPLLRETRQNPVLWHSIMGISWFWFTGSLFLSLLPNYVRDILNGSPALVTYLLTLFVIGIALGSAAAHRVLNGEVNTRYVPLGIILMALAILFLSVLSAFLPVRPNVLPLPQFLFSLQGVSLSLLFMMLAGAGGFYTVPLQATLQARSEPSQRSRIIASNNIVNALFMVLASVFSFVFFKLGFGTVVIFGAIAVLSLLAAFLATEYLPYRLYSALLRLKFSFWFGARLLGREHILPLKKRGVIYVANHTSSLDGLLLAAFLPGCPVIAAPSSLARSWLMALYHLFAGHPVLNPSDPSAVKYLVNALKNGRPVVLFPEGRMTQTGLLMKVYETPGVLARMAKAPIVPVRIDGAQYTPFSLLRSKVRMRLFPRITVTVLPPVTLKGETDMSSRARRLSFGEQLYDIMAGILFASCNLNQTLYEAFLDSCRIHGPGTGILEDVDRKPLSYRKVAIMSRILGRSLSAFTTPGEKTGVMLPNAAGTVGAFLGLLAFGRVPALLNFTAGLGNLESACVTAGIKTILTSRRFVQLLELEPVIEALSQKTRVVYLEDLKKSFGFKAKLRGLLDHLLTGYLYKKLKASPDDPAVVLFTSGSESAPKGVVLSHKNILANRYQAASRIDLNANDILFNALPLFHSFGLSVGLFLPLLSGVKTFLYPSPLHYRVIPELVYETNATILISTDTFLNGYARMAHPFDFYSLRYVVAGGEKLKDETRKLWFDKFGIRILEGYGVTETSPVLAVNTAMHHKTGTVGRFLPGIEYRLRKIEGIDAGGSLVVRGPNVMLGYLKEDLPCVLRPPENGWHDTGDVVDVDENGFVSIIGRAKRFAKIGGEMISLAAVETLLQELCPGNLVAVTVAPDTRKGEQLVLFTDCQDLSREAVVGFVQKRHMPEIMIPRRIVKLDALPLLGTGKIDYVALGHLAREQVREDGASQ